LAPRLPTLEGRTVLFFDNGKLRSDLGGYQAVFDTLTRELTRRFPAIRIRTHTRDLVASSPEGLAILADALSNDTDAVILALGDSAVASPSAVLAAAFEARSIPTVLICKPIGLRIASFAAAQMVPGLPLLSLDDRGGATSKPITDGAGRLVDDVVDGLLGTH
jgi:hypothetical protein